MVWQLRCRLYALNPSLDSLEGSNSLQAAALKRTIYAAGFQLFLGTFHKVVTEEDDYTKHLVHILRGHYRAEEFTINSLQRDDLGQSLCLQRVYNTASFDMFLARFKDTVCRRAGR